MLPMMSRDAGKSQNTNGMPAEPENNGALLWNRTQEPSGPPQMGRKEGKVGREQEARRPKPG